MSCQPRANRYYRRTRQRRALCSFTSSTSISRPVDWVLHQACCFSTRRAVLELLFSGPPDRIGWRLRSLGLCISCHFFGLHLPHLGRVLKRWWERRRHGEQRRDDQPSKWRGVG